MIDPFCIYTEWSFDRLWEVQVQADVKSLTKGHLPSLPSKVSTLTLDLLLTRLTVAYGLRS